MRQRISTIFSVIVGLLLLAAIGWAIWWMLTGGLQKEVVAPIVAGLAALGGILLSQYMARRATVAEDIRKQKVEVYKEFLTFAFRLFQGTSDKGEELSEAEIQGFFWGWTPKLLMWGPDPVVNTYVAWKNIYTENTNINPATAVIAFEQLLFALRADVGHLNKGLEQGDILSLFITDIRELLSSTKTS